MKNVFSPFRQTNTPSGLSGGLEAAANGMRKSNKRQQTLREGWTFLGDCLACRYAWKSVTEWEHRNQIYSHALETAGGQQQRHYEQKVANFLCLTGSMCGARQESAGVSGSADGDGDVNVCCMSEGERSAE